MGDVKAGGCLGRGDQEIAEFSILAALGFWKANFDLFWRLLLRTLEDSPEESRKAGQSGGRKSSKLRSTLSC